MSLMKRSPFFRLSLTLPLLLTACGDSTNLGDGDEERVPPLVDMAERGDLAGLERLLRKDPEPNVRDSCDWTPLMKAALNGHLEAVERLLAAGATVDSEDKGGYTALMLAASNNHATVVEQLLAHGAMVDHQEGTQGWTALIWAAKQGYAPTVTTLMRHQSDPTLKDFSGRTAADWAREAGHRDLVALLEPGDTR
jgi:ankyrin repeat protein